MVRPKQCLVVVLGIIGVTTLVQFNEFILNGLIAFMLGGIIFGTGLAISSIIMLLFSSLGLIAAVVLVARKLNYSHLQSSPDEVLLVSAIQTRLRGSLSSKLKS